MPSNFWGLAAEHGRPIAGRLFAFMASLLPGATPRSKSPQMIADLVIHAYTAHAPECGISLAPYAAIRSWFARVEALPPFEPMPRSAIAVGASQAR